MKDYYKYREQLDSLIKIDKPTEQDLQKVLDIINDDTDLAIYFYKTNTNAEWLDKLNTAGQFKQLEDAEVTNDFLVRNKAFYLVEVSKEKPKEVVDLNLNLNVKDLFIRGILLQALLAKPLEIVDEGTELIKKYFDEPIHTDWYIQGDHSAEFMVAIAETYPDKAFEIAKVLLKIERQDDNKYADRAKTQFDDYHYEELLSKYCKNLWQVYPLETTKLLIDVFKDYLKKLESDDYDLESGFHSAVERLDQIESGYTKRSIRNIIQGICEAGKEVIGNEHEKTNELFSYLESADSPIFERIEMYLLRFVPADQQKDRIDALIGNPKFLDYKYRYEYQFLLRDKFEKIYDEAKKMFTDSVKEMKISKEDRRYFSDWYEEDKGNREKPDFDKILNRRKAKQLSLVREKFPEIYRTYQLKSGCTDEELEPKPRMSEVKCMSGKEGAPLGENDMLEMKPIAVIEYLRDPAKWEASKTDEWAFHSPQKALAYVFEDVVKKRAGDYASLELNQLQKLEHVFVERYFSGICNLFREEDVQEKNILNVLKNSKSIVTDNFESSEHEWTFRCILDMINIIFDKEEFKKSIVPENSQLIWYIIDKLRAYKGDEKDFSSERDAHTACINSVSGKAFSSIVRFGLFFRNLNEADYNENWSDKIKNSVEDVIDNDQRRWVRCVLGTDFPQIHWLEKKFIKGRIDKIFDVNNDETWRDVWGSYLSWSRAYKNVFRFLVKKGKYVHALSKIGTYGEGVGFAKDIDEGLVQHLMIAYFNNWIKWKSPLLKRFFRKAPVELRAKAASFLHTGFKPTLEKKSEDPKDYKRKAKRIRVYWNARINEMKSKNDPEEAIGLIGWVKDSLLGANETLELIFQTLELTDGKLGENRSEVDFINAVCKVGKGHELLALRCMNKMMEGKPEWLHFSLYVEELNAFMEHIVALAANDEDIREQAIELINAYGRRGVDNLKSYYDRL